jgi:hypothetical protein
MANRRMEPDTSNGDAGIARGSGSGPQEANQLPAAADAAQREGKRRYLAVLARIVVLAELRKEKLLSEEDVGNDI